MIVRTALDKKATSPAILDVADLLGYADYFVVVNGRGPRQVRAIADAVRQTLKHDHDLLPRGTEGKDGGRWVLVDFDDVVLHVFQESAREFYDLDGLWDEAPRLPVPEHEVEDDDKPLFILP